MLNSYSYSVYLTTNKHGFYFVNIDIIKSNRNIHHALEINNVYGNYCNNIDEIQ